MIFTFTGTPGSIRAECSICGHRTKAARAMDRARHAAAQHLWTRRADHHARPKSRTQEKKREAQLRQANRERHKVRLAERLAARAEKCPTPEKKGAYLTKEQALNVIRDMYRNGRGNPDLNAYQCRCGFWHVGHNLRHFQKRIKQSLRGLR